MTLFQLNSLESDLHFYLRDKNAIHLPDFSAVVVDVVAFTSAVVQNGFRKALAQLPQSAERLADHPFIEMADAVVEHHLRLVSRTDREIVRKSILEAYFHAAGPQYAFEPPNKTQFVRFLRRWGAKDFAALLLSLHVFNSISLAIQDDIRAKMPDVRSFELTMLGLESICRDAVKSAIQQTGLKEPSEYWAKEVLQHIEEQLLHASSPA